MPLPNQMELPLVSVIVPTFNCSQSITTTIESILNQNYSAVEILAIDAGSTDRTLEILQSFRVNKIRLIAAESYHVYRMINKGMTLTKGEYVNILFPGDFYIHDHVLFDMMHHALANQKPCLVYCGTLLHDRKNETRFLFRQLNLQLLKLGKQPTSLQGCWFKKDIFETIGYFDSSLFLRGGFEFFCRLCQHLDLRLISLHRAFIDHDLRWVNSRMVIRHFWETLIVIYRYFGFFAALKWIGHQKDFSRFVKLWMRRLKLAFLGE